MAFAPPGNLSPSSIGTLSQCPLRFKYGKIDKLREPSSEEALMGTMTHEILEGLFRLPADERTLDAAKDIATKLWFSKWEKEIEGVVTKAVNFRQQVWWFVENYFEMEDPTSFDPIGLEEWLKGKVGGVPIIGIVDRMSQGTTGVVISDYKTGKRPQREDWAADKVFQLDLYEVLASQTWGPIEKMEFLDLKSGQRVTYEPDPERRAVAIKKVQDAWAEVLERCEKEDFPPQKSRLCDWCGHRGICPAWN